MTLRLAYTHLARLSLTRSAAVASSTARTQTLINQLRDDHVVPELPVLLPRDSGCLPRLPCIERWFVRPAATSDGDGDGGGNAAWALNSEYLVRFGRAVVQVEATLSGDAGGGAAERFSRHDAPLQLFLDWAASSPTSEVADDERGPDAVRLYIAQTPLDSLPGEMQRDVPLPLLLGQLGRGDVYGSSLWLGLGATRTPLHRDPNPNLFVQLAGRKRLRLMRPVVGDAVFASLRAGRGGAGRIRGEEMMAGPEAGELDRVVWRDAVQEQTMGYEQSLMYEAVVESGDAVFVPKGWWHAVRGEGHGINASVNWWFR